MRPRKGLQVFFTLACIVSAVSLGMKCHLLVSKLKSRFRLSSGIETMYDPAASDPDSRLRRSSKNVDDIQTKLEANKFTRRRLYAYFLLAVFEDIPMGVLNFVYLARSVLECVDAAFDIQAQPCDLQPNSMYTILLLLSAMTSAAMLAAKVSELTHLRDEWRRQGALVTEQELLLEDIGNSIDPSSHLFVKITEILRLHHKRSSLTHSSTRVELEAHPSSFSTVVPIGAGNIIQPVSP